MMTSGNGVSGPGTGTTTSNDSPPHHPQANRRHAGYDKLVQLKQILAQVTLLMIIMISCTVNLKCLVPKHAKRTDLTLSKSYMFRHTSDLQ